MELLRKFGKKKIQEKLDKYKISSKLINIIHTENIVSDEETPLTAVKNYDIDAFLINCCSANMTSEAMKIFANEVKKPFGGYANSEIVDYIELGDDALDNAEDLQRESRKPINADQYSESVKEWIKTGASIVGGCCRTTPKHIEKIHQMINN